MAMATANRRADRRPERSGDGDIGEEALATKVVLMELVDAPRPLSVVELTDRTTLSETTVKSALAALASTGVCKRASTTGHRKPRFRLERESLEDESQWA